MQILIYGAGALGQAVGCLLAAAGHSVDMILRPRFIRAIRENGLSVTGIFGDYHVAADRLGLHEKVGAVIDSGYDYAIITTKTYDTLTAITDLKKLHRQKFTVVTMQNGCGNLEAAVEHFGETRTLAARVITGFEIVRAGIVKITVTADAVHIGGNREGATQVAAKKLADAIHASGLPCETSENIRGDLFAKLLYNCALNPLGAVLGVHYGALAEHPETKQIMNRLIDETFAVIKAVGGSTSWPDAQAYRRFFYAKQIPATHDHRPSMLQDLENGKPTEVEAMTGYVSARGREKGIPTPTCDLINALVRFKEKHKSLAPAIPVVMEKQS